MTDTTLVPQGIDTTTAQAALVAPPIVPAPVAPAANAEPEVRMTPAQLKARLDETRVAAEKRAAEQFAASLGVDLDTAKKLIADAKARDDAQKSEVQRLTEQLAAERARLAQFDAYKTTVEARASHEFSALDEAQRAAVEALAGNDPAARLRTIDTLRPTWVKAAEDAAQAAAVRAAAEKALADAQAAAAAKPAKIPAPASTAPAAPPPAPAAPGTPTNHLAVWESLQTTNPAAAAKYRSAHYAAISAAMRHRTG